MRRTFIIVVEWKAEWTADNVCDWLKLAIRNQIDREPGPNVQSFSGRPQQKFDPTNPSRRKPGRPPNMQEPQS